MPVPKLTDAEIVTALGTLPGWSVADGKLRREYRFPNFIQAFGFMATAAIALEKMAPHPEWCNVYNRVCVDLTTHDAGGITHKDVELARLLESLAARMQ